MPSTTTERIQLIIEAQDKASKQIGDLTKRIDTLGKQSTRSSAMAGELGRALGSMVGPLSIAGVIALGKRVADTATELAGLGAQVKMVSGAFDDMAGSQASAMLEKLRRTARGSIDDYSLMLSANRAMMLGVTQDAEGMSKLLEVAMRRGAAMGLSTQQAFNDIVTGIGRASPMILDNLGIVVNAKETYEAYAKSIGVATDALSEQQKTQALAARVMAEATGDSGVGDDVLAPAQLETSMANLRQEIGLSLEGWRQLMTEIAEGAQKTTDYLRNKREAEAGLDIDYYIGIAKSQNPKAPNFQQIIAPINAVVDALATGKITFDEARTALDEMFGLAPYWAAEMAGTNVALVEHAAYIDMVGTAAGRAHAALKQLYDWEAMFGGTVAGRASRDAVLGITDIPDPYDVQRSGGAYEWEFAVWQQGAALDAAVAGQELADAKAAAAEARANAQRAAAEARAAAQQAAAEQRSFVESLLSPTQVTAADMAATEMGVYDDKWDEAVRRFRMSEKGHNAYEVAEYERQFYGGQMLDKVNWGDAELGTGFLGAAKQAIEEKQGRENLVEIGVTKLREAGISLSKAEVGEIMGLPEDYASVGQDRMGEMVAGAKTVNFAGEVTTAITEAFTAEEKRWKASGKITMGYFLTGANDAITPATASAFVGKMWPWFAPLVEKMVGDNP